MKFTLGFLFGAAIGGIVVHYLRSEEGSALTDRIRQDANDISERLADIGNTISEKARNLTGKQPADLPAEEQIVIVGVSTDSLT